MKTLFPGGSAGVPPPNGGVIRGFRPPTAGATLEGGGGGGEGHKATIRINGDVISDNP